MSAYGDFETIGSQNSLKSAISLVFNPSWLSFDLSVASTSFDATTNPVVGVLYDAPLPSQ